MKGVFLLAHGHTNNINLIKLDPTVKPMSLSDLRAFFETNQDTIDANIKALFDRIEAVAAAGYTPIQPVNLPDSAFKVRIENASTRFDIPAMIAAFPPQTPVRITGFTITMSTVQDIVNFYDLIKTMYGLDASNNGLDRIQMHGTIRLVGGNSASPLTVSGAQMRSWNREFPSITVIPERISNTIAYYNFDGSELLHTETVYDGADAAYGVVIRRDCENEGYMYSFIGWSPNANSSVANANLQNVTEEKTVYAAYVYLEDIAPDITITSYSEAVSYPCVITLNSLGSYTKLTGITAYNSSDSVLSDVVGSNVIRLEENTITVTPTEAYFNGHDWALTFSDDSGSCVRSVPLNLKNGPLITAITKLSTGADDPATVEVSWGNYNVSQYYCSYRPGTKTQYMTLTVGNGVRVSGDVITITPTLMPSNITSQYLEFTSQNGDTVRISVNIFADAS